MTSAVNVLRLELRASRRPEVLNLRGPLADALEDGPLRTAKRLLCVSYHTTAGFLDRRLRSRIGADGARLDAVLDALAAVFPPEAGYEHDRLHLRDELTAAQKEREPLNADAHLAFIGGGFRNCTICDARADTPLWFIDFDGIYHDRRSRVVQRTRQATVIGYDDEEVVDRLRIEVPVPRGPAAVRLDHPDFALADRIRDAIRSAGIGAGRVRIHLGEAGTDAGITVNEFEALLMERDLTRVLADPFGYAGVPRGAEEEMAAAIAEITAASPGAEEGGAARRKHGSIVPPALVTALHGALSALHISPGRLDRLIGRTLESPSSRVLRMQRDLSLAILPQVEPVGGGPVDPGAIGTLVRGTYQSPILVQREGTERGARTLMVSLRRFR